MSDSPAGLRAAKTRLSALAKATPGLLEGFGKISKLATTDGHFSAADKELMELDYLDEEQKKKEKCAQFR